MPISQDQLKSIAQGDAKILSDFEDAPKDSILVSNGIDFMRAISASDKKYVKTTMVEQRKNFDERLLRHIGINLKNNTLDPPQNQHIFLYGHTGCGKSTELARLVKDQIQKHYLVVDLDILDALDIGNVQVHDVWVAAMDRLLAVCADKYSVDTAHIDAIHNWFKQRVQIEEIKRELSVEINAGVEAKASLFSVTKIFAQLKSRFKYASEHREELRRNIDNSYPEFAAAFNQLLRGVEIAAKQSILIAIDGTDRLRGDEDNNQWKKFFIDNFAQLTAINAVVIYTAPLALRISPHKQNTLFNDVSLPMIALFDKSGKKIEEAFNTLRQIVLLRAHHSLFESMETLDTLISCSGGHLRDLLRLLKYVAIEAFEERFDGPTVNNGIERLRSDYNSIIREEYYPELVKADAQVAHTGNTDHAVQLIYQSALLEYNGNTWRRSHPVVRDLPGYLAAAKQTQAET